MSYTNGTNHYNLPQTVGTDKRDWFDTNEAFAAVDAALHTASETASGAASDIVALGGRVTDLETASGSQAQDIVDIKADILSQGGAITRLDGEIDDVRADALDMICAVDEGTAQVATVAVTAGQYFRYNDVLYIATANIGVGDTIIPNTNCKATNVATELQDLSAPTASDVSYNNTSSGLTADDVQEAIDELHTALVYKLIGTQTGQTPLSIPSGATELLVLVNNNRVDGPSVIADIVSINIPTSILGTTPKQFTCAGGAGGSSLYVTLRATSTSINLQDSMFGGDDISTTSDITVYYK